MSFQGATLTDPPCRFPAAGSSSATHCLVQGYRSEVATEGSGGEGRYSSPTSAATRAFGD